MLNYDQKRVINSKITAGFLNNDSNREIINTLIGEFGKCMRQSLGERLPDCLFYLKGGNAFSLLEGKPLTGDYDFQLLPSPADYANWEMAFYTLDTLIINAMKVSASQITQTFNDDIFELTKIKALVPEIDLNGVEKGHKLCGTKYSGKEYGSQDYTQIIKAPNYNGSYLEYVRPVIDEQSWSCALSPIIYVNYTIPSFILYRLMYGYKYSYLNASEHKVQLFDLRSEIIDVTIPRKGSAEVFLSQHGVVTHFTRHEKGYDIPGWGYHFYENINMLQEIKLGISRSADKEEKRAYRGKQAMKELQKLNSGGLFQESIVESRETEERRIQGYVGALTYQISCIVDVAERQEIAALAAEIKGRLSKNYWKAMTSCAQTTLELENYVTFWLDTCSSRPQIEEQKKIFDELTAMEQNYDSKKQADEPARETLNCRYIPLLHCLYEKYRLPIDFMVFLETDPLYDAFLKYAKEMYPQNEDLIDCGEGFYKIFRIGSYEFYLIVLKSGADLPKSQNYFEPFLEKSLLTVQRYPFIKVLYPEAKKIHQPFSVPEADYAAADCGNSPARSDTLESSVSRGEGEIQSIDQILSQFKIDVSEFHFCDFLPSGMEKNLFDRLLMKSFSMETDKETVYALQLDVLSKTPWNIFDSVSIFPQYNIRIYAPHNPALRSVAFDAWGEWKLGKTTYVIYADPYLGDVRFYMKTGENLDFKPFCELFLNAPIPELQIETLYASMNYKLDSWEIRLKASDVWKFSILGKELSAESVELNVWKQQGTYAVVIKGSFALLGVLFDLTCRYRGGGVYSLSAGTASDIKIKFSSFMQEFFNGTAENLYIPEGFMDVDIHELRLSYDRTDRGSSVDFRADIEYVLSITDQFKIDQFFIEAKITDGKTDFIYLNAKFDIDGWVLLLSFEKRENGLCLSGGTGPGQEIPIEILLDAFLDKVLGYSVHLPDCLSTFIIRRIHVCYEKGTDKSSFYLDGEAFFLLNGGALDRFFTDDTHIIVYAVNSAGVWSYAFQISSEMVLAENQVLQCSWKYDETEKTGSNTIMMKYQGKEAGDEIAFGKILEKLGIQEIDNSWEFLTETGITRAEITYDFVKKEFSASLWITGGSSLTLRFACGEKTEFQIVLASKEAISLAKLPVVGGFAERFDLPSEQFSLSNLTFYALSPLYADKKILAGAGLSFLVCGEEKYCQIYEMRKKAVSLPQTEKTAPKTIWIRIDKQAAVLSLHRMGIALSGAELGILFDASLNVSPLTFEMLGLGAYVNITDPAKTRFALSGLGISLETARLSLTGSFMRTSGKDRDSDIYAGCLALSVGTLSVFAVGQYSDGSLMAYACADVPLGGPPAFFIKGFAAGFGYNQALALPEIENVPAYPLISGAAGKVSRADLPEALAEYITPSCGQFFAAAGLHFTSFEIADSVAVATVSFGKKMQIGLLGLSDISMPPNCGGNPIAHARLALRASFLPDDGVIRAEALLTSESYILSKDCKLTGGFAFYLWFGGEHTGDFVLTLGGYHPAFKKPAHYPAVPRLGFCWDVIPEHPNRLVLSGELYFALTPSVIMAGGRLSAVYSDGPLCAWFAVQADFLLGWKPFHYDIRAAISLGASYRVDCLFVHRTFKIELGCGLHLWGAGFHRDRACFVVYYLLYHPFWRGCGPGAGEDFVGGIFRILSAQRQACTGGASRGQPCGERGQSAERRRIEGGHRQSRKRQ